MSNHPLYTVSRCRLDERLFGPLHGSDGKITLCGVELNDTRWWIVTNDGHGEITCRACLNRMGVMRELTDYDRQILNLLGTKCGWTTGQVAEQVLPKFGTSNHQHAGAVRSWLLRLEKEGRVKRMDAEKPTVWLKTTHPSE